MMKKTKPAANPLAYVNALDGWRHQCVVALRQGILSAASVDDIIKWRNLVYLANGPVLVIRAEKTRVLFGFWRGKRMRHTEPRLKPGGKYEMATVELHDGDTVEPDVVRKLVKTAVALNRKLGDPSDVVKTRDQPDP